MLSGVRFRSDIREPEALQITLVWNQNVSEYLCSGLQKQKAAGNWVGEDDYARLVQLVAEPTRENEGHIGQRLWTREVFWGTCMALVHHVLEIQYLKVAVT